MGETLITLSIMALFSAVVLAAWAFPRFGQRLDELTDDLFIEVEE